MEYRRGEACALVLHTGMQKPDDEIGILEPPARIPLVESVRVREVRPPRREVARLHAFPASASAAAKSAVRQREKRKRPVHVAPQPRGDPARIGPAVYGQAAT